MSTAASFQPWYRLKTRRPDAEPASLAACGKHFAGYGAAEGGRDYNSARIPERTLVGGEESILSGEGHSRVISACPFPGRWAPGKFSSTTIIWLPAAWPVRELKGFERVTLKPGESRGVSFTLHTDDLAFHNQAMERVTEPGEFQVWVGPDAERGLEGGFSVR